MKRSHRFTIFSSLLGLTCLVAGLIAMPPYAQRSKVALLTDFVLIRDFQAKQSELRDIAERKMRMTSAGAVLTNPTFEEREVAQSTYSKLSLKYDFVDSNNFVFLAVHGKTDPPGSYKGYAYCPGQVPYKVVNSLDNTNSLVRPGFTLRRVEGDWYLFIFTFLRDVVPE